MKYYCRVLYIYYIFVFFIFFPADTSKYSRSLTTLPHLDIRVVGDFDPSLLLGQQSQPLLPLVREHVDPTWPQRGAGAVEIATRVSHLLGVVWNLREGTR